MNLSFEILIWVLRGFWDKPPSSDWNLWIPQFSSFIWSEIENNSKFQNRFEYIFENVLDGKFKLIVSAFSITCCLNYVLQVYLDTSFMWSYSFSGPDWTQHFA